MKLYVLFGQRKERYPEEYAPEALEVMDEYGYDENAEWLHKKKAKYDADGEFVATRIIAIEGLAQGKIRELLVGTPVIEGTVEEPRNLEGFCAECGARATRREVDVLLCDAC